MQQQQQQHLMQMQPIMSAYYPNTITSDHIQQYLDENKSLILKIVESQNSGKLNECAENQARLQKNLMYLAAIADSQPQPPAMHSQFATSSMMQSGSPYMQQHQQAQQMTPQSLMAARSSMMYNSQNPYAALQQHQALHSQLGMSSGGLHMLQGEATAGGSSDFGRIESGGSKHDIWSGDHHGANSSSGDGREGMYMNSSADDGN
ncbi:unnamed protein product [Rhodiola kirilowii]